MKQIKTYSQEFKDKLIKEYEDTKNLSLVSAKHDVPVTTLRYWVYKTKPKSEKVKEKQRLIQLEKELHRKDIENQILKELLKKTNQIWLKD